MAEDSRAGVAGADVRMLPTTAGALMVGGQVYSHTAIRGEHPPNWHPLVRRFLDQLPVDQRERYAGWCAEVVLVSDRLYALDADRAAAGSGPATATEARAALWGASIRVARVREASDPTHGETQPPCRTCAALLDWLGVRVIDR
jgi:hypothetical protein